MAELDPKIEAALGKLDELIENEVKKVGAELKTAEKNSKALDKLTKQADDVEDMEE